MTVSSGGENDHLVQIAENALRLLDRQVELARVEARRSELVTAIQHARQGDERPLRAWLSLNDRYVAIDQTPAMESSCPIDSPTVRQVAAMAPATGWQNIRERSLERLRNTQIPEVLPEVLPEQITKNKAEPDGELDSVPKEPSSSLPAFLTANTPAFDLRAEATEPRVTKRRWQLSGVLVSTLLHILLVIGLGVITIAIPVDSGIIDLQASESVDLSQQSFELLSGVTADSPSEQFEVSSTQPQADLSNLLATQSNSTLESLGEMDSTADAAQFSSSLATMGHSPKNLNASFYGASAEGNCFCFLIDGSGTLRGAPWEAARAELLKTLQSLSPKQRYYVIFYNQVVSRVPDRETAKPATAPIYATRDHLLNTARWLQTLRVDTAPPGGNHTTVLQAALDLEPDAIFMLTDGEMTPGVERQVLQMLRNANRLADVVEGEIVRTPIHTITFHSLSGIETMKKIAEQNGGQMTFVPKPTSNAR